MNTQTFLAFSDEIMKIAEEKTVSEDSTIKYLNKQHPVKAGIIAGGALGGIFGVGKLLGHISAKVFTKGTKYANRPEPLTGHRIASYLIGEPVQGALLGIPATYLGRHIKNKIIKKEASDDKTVRLLTPEGAERTNKLITRYGPAVSGGIVGLAGGIGAGIGSRSLKTALKSGGIIAGAAIPAMYLHQALTAKHTDSAKYERGRASSLMRAAERQGYKVIPTDSWWDIDRAKARAILQQEAQSKKKIAKDN
jgi:hypothetical protein